MSTLICFTTNSARIFRKPLPYVGKWPNSFFDPDLSLVSGVLPQYWKIVGEQIHPMTDREKHYRDALIAEGGMDNQIRRLNLNEILVDPDKIVFKKPHLKVIQEKELQEEAEVPKTLDARSIVKALELISSDMYKFNRIQIVLIGFLVAIVVIHEMVRLL